MPKIQLIGGRYDGLQLQNAPYTFRDQLRMVANKVNYYYEFDGVNFIYVCWQTERVK